MARMARTGPRGRRFLPLPRWMCRESAALFHSEDRESEAPPAAIETHATAPDAEALARVGSEVLAVEEFHTERAGEVGDWD